ncbi:MAG: RnfABCDGE type electron transport complex subunit D [Oligoflexia bacterium]|nr:RnfABCDGE type electron transport complex subunit D [Oligoflexia bacterium]
MTHFSRQLFLGTAIKIQSPPHWRDARYLQLAILLAYSISAREIFSMDRPHWVTALCCGTALLLDVLIGVLKYRVLRFPISALIIGLATSLLLDSRFPALYVLAVSLAIFSKGLLRNGNSHIFNPANFGVVAVLLCFSYYATGIPSLFSGLFLPSLTFFALGCITVVYAKQAIISAAWIVGFLFFAWVRAFLSGGSPIAAALPILSPALLLFSFHMISDPATAPQSTRAGITYAVFIAFFDAVLRFYQVPYGNFYALFLTSACIPTVVSHLKRQRPEAF